MGMFANLAGNQDALAMLAGANGLANFTPIPTTRVPMSPAFGLASGLQAGAKGMQQTIPQMAMLSNMKAMQDPNSPYASLSPMARALLAQAAASGDSKLMIETEKSIYENDPGIAAAKTQAVQDNTWIPQYDHSFKLGSQMRAEQSPPAGAPIPFGFPTNPQQPAANPPASPANANPTIAPPAPVGMTNLPPMGAPPQANSMAPIPFGLTPPPTPAQMTGGPSQGQFSSIPPIPPAPTPPAQNSPASPPNPLMAADGKLIVPEMKNAAFYPPDQKPNNPIYPYEKNDLGKERSTTMFNKDSAANDAMTDTITNAEQQTARISDMEDALRSGQAGALASQNPKFFNKLIAGGVVDDQGTIKNVGEYQRFEADQVQEVLAQLKSIIPAGSRINRAEFTALTDKLSDPSDRPQAISDSLAMAQGLADYQRDMVKSWNSPAVGGLSNRIGGAGYTMRPSTFQERWQENHDITDYVNQYKATAKPLMGQQSPSRPPLSSFMGN